MNLTISPVLPFGWWVVIAIVSVLFIISWGTYARSQKTLNGSWILSVSIIIALLLTMLNPGVVTTSQQEANVDPSQKDKVESSYDIYFVVDTTSSIAAEDWADSQPRLVGVKSDIADIVAQYTNSRFTLITFDSVATMRVPITNDSSAVLSTTSALQQEVTGNSRGSSISEAAILLKDTLAKNSDPDRQSIVFFFSDGEQTSNEEIASFDESAQYISSGLVLGYGTEQGAHMKSRIGYAEPSKPYISGTDSKEGFSIINETNLMNISNQLGVQYTHRELSEKLDVAPDSESSAIGKIDTKRFGVFGLYWVFSIITFLLLTMALISTSLRIKKYTVTSKRRVGVQK